MKKLIRVLFLAVAVLGVAACGGSTEIQDVQVQTTPVCNEQSVYTQNHTSGQIIEDVIPTGEILAGTVQSIDGMSLSVDTSSVFVAMGTGSHTVSPGEEPEPHEDIVRITEQTIIEIQTLAGGQILGTAAATLDDISLQAVIMAEGEWKDGEFVATKITIMNF